MVDSKSKGTRNEYAVRDLLKEATGLGWERVPGSGGFGAMHGLKGDIYLPSSTGKISNYTIEVKAYAEDVITSNLLNPTVSQLEKFWEQTTREAGQMNNKPMLVFKKDRSKFLVALLEELPINSITFSKNGTTFHIYRFEEALQYLIPVICR